MKRARQDDPAEPTKVSRTKTTKSYSHPFNVRPLANLLLNETYDDQVRSDGLGVFSELPDLLLLYILKKLSAKELCSCSSISKIFLIFCSTDQLWEVLCFEKFGFTMPVSSPCWKYTFLGSSFQDQLDRTTLNLPQIYSDHLYFDWFYSQVDITPWIGHDNIERRSGLTIDQFNEEYNLPNKPVILTDLSTPWPCKETWTKANLNSRGRRVLAGITSLPKVNTKFQHYYTSMFHLAPPYTHSLFIDPNNGQDKITRPEEYSVPPYFTQDLFSVLSQRPQFRWLLIGAARSGSCFHQDPNFTAAWNTSLYGRKKFVLFPGDIVPPGIEQTGPDDFVPPTIVMDWFVKHYSTLKRGISPPPGPAIFPPTVEFVWYRTNRTLCGPLRA